MVQGSHTSEGICNVHTNTMPAGTYLLHWIVANKIFGIIKIEIRLLQAKSNHYHYYYLLKTD